mgnify:CR=1 FL=1
MWGYTVKLKLILLGEVSPQISDRRKFPTIVREQLENVCSKERSDTVGNSRLSEICGEMEMVVCGARARNWIVTTCVTV